MRASIVVIAHNEGAELRATVDALLASTPAGTEIIVVDDQSDDGSPAMVPRAPGVTVLSTTERCGVAGSRNLGARHATGDVLVFSDGHVRPDPDWLPPLLDELSSPAVGAVAPVIVPLRDKGPPGYGFTWRSPRLTTAWITRPTDAPQPVPMLCGCFQAVRRDAFARLGGFDRGLEVWGMEDADLSLCIWRLGLECRVVPASRIEHLFRRAFPYGVGWPVTLHNTLRVATIHLAETALARVVAEHARHPQFAEAIEHVLVGDAFRRRAWLDRECVRDAGWVIERFGIEALR
jgi:GT2 family glycosyltransferase